MPQPKLQLPPYGRELAARLRGDLRDWWGAAPNGKAAPIMLLTGPDAWRAAQDWRNHRLIALHPYESNPATYNWRVLAGHDPVLLWRCGPVEGDAVIALMRAIMMDGVQRVLDVAHQRHYVARRGAT